MKLLGVYLLGVFTPILGWALLFLMAALISKVVGKWRFRTGKRS